MTMKTALLLALLAQSVAGFATPAATTTQSFYQPDGGIYELANDAAAALGKVKLEPYKTELQKEMDIDADWSTVEQVAVDPKGALVAMIVNSLNNKDGSIEASSSSENKLQAMLSLLQAQGKGFDADLVEGEWAFVLNKSAEKSPGIQKLVAAKETVGKTFANFNTKTRKFLGNVLLWKGLVELRSTVKYNPVREGYSVVKGKIVLRRIMCDIVGASLKIWKLPRIPLPLRAKGGFLDFIYLDQDIRITKGNRGGVFVHFRPDYLKQVM